jgi:excisionase family DNA binding protein
LTRDRVTIQEASLILSIGRKTIYRWIDKGLLSKTKEGKNAYVSLAEVRALYVRGDTQADTLNVSGDVTDIQTDTHHDTLIDTQEPHRGTNTAIVEVSYLEGLLVRLGQLEAEKRYLLEYKTGLEVKDKELAETMVALAKANGELKKMVELKQGAERNRAELERKNKKLADLRAELDRARMPFWKRWFKK